ncbi:MAG: DUF1489 family protein [Magnetovibrionaceae bacterium]
MTASLHMLKLCVGAETVEDLSGWQAGRLALTGEIIHTTRMRPKRADEMLDGGSIYWVIKGVIQVRQAFLDLRDGYDEQGRPATQLVLHPDLVRVEPRAHRPFQGWRYFPAEKVPPDLSAKPQGDKLPPELAAELQELGLL